MGIFDLKGSSGGERSWNYAYPDQPNYMPCIEGTVVEVSNPQSINFNSKKPEFWDDGNPKRNICLTILGKSGKELNWVFNPKSVSANACLDALDPENSRPNVSVTELLGRFIRVQTQEGVYNKSHPRPWWVTILGDGEANKVRGVVDLSKQQPQQQAQPEAPVSQGRNNFGPPPAAAQPPAQGAEPMAYAQQAAAQAMGFQQPQQQQPVTPEDAYTAMYADDIPF